VLGPEGLFGLMSISDIAGILDSQGKYEAGEEMYSQVLELRKKVLGFEHSSTVGSMNMVRKSIRRPTRSTSGWRS
jgi:hypothetical protein